MEAFFQSGATKVDEEPYAPIGQPEIRKKLLAVNWSECLNRLDLDDDRSVNEQIETEPFVENDSVIFKANWLCRST